MSDVDMYRMSINYGACVPVAKLMRNFSDAIVDCTSSMLPPNTRHYFANHREMAPYFAAEPPSFFLRRRSKDSRIIHDYIIVFSSSNTIESLEHLTCRPLWSVCVSRPHFVVSDVCTGMHVESFPDHFRLGDAWLVSLYISRRFEHCHASA